MIKILIVSIKSHFLHMGRQYFVKKIDNLTIQLLDFRGSIDIVLHHSPVTALQYILIHYHAICIHHRGERRMIEIYSKQMHLPHSNFTKYYRRTKQLSTHSNSNKFTILRAISNETQWYISRVALFAGNSMKFFTGFKDLSPLLYLIVQL